MELHENRQPKRKASVRTQMGDDDGDHSTPRKKQHQQPLPAASNININGGSSEIDLDFFKKMPAGYRFCPSDEDAGCSSRPTKQQQRQPPNYINEAVDDDAAETVEAEADDECCKNDINEMNLEFFDLIPPGYRFCPSDEELIIHYLKKKVMEVALPENKIVDVNLYNHNPEFLAEKYKKYGENEWFFFTPRDKKYPNGTRPNRVAGDGYWKATGSDKEIKLKNETIGYRKALVFYRGKPTKGSKTNWIMHEYRVNGAPPPKESGGENHMRLDDWILCRIYEKKDKSTKNQSNNPTSEEDGSVVIETNSMNSNCSNNIVDSIGHIPQQNYNIPQPLSSQGKFVHPQHEFHIQDTAAAMIHNSYTTHPYTVEPLSIMPPMENIMRSKYIQQDEANQMRFHDNFMGNTNMDYYSYLQSQELFDSNNFDFPYFNFDCDLPNNINAPIDNPPKPPHS